MKTINKINNCGLQLLALISALGLTACQSVYTDSNQLSAASVANSAVAPAPMASIGAWTQSDFANAKPLPLPVASGTVADMKLLGARATPLSEPSISFDGRKGDASMGGARNLFDVSALPAPTAAAPLAVGSRGAYYSSSRLIPQDARLYYPYSTSGKIFFKDQNGNSFVCSGSVIKKRLIATAGHCVHAGSGGANGYYRDIVFVPAYSSNGTQAPYGTWAASWFKATPSWIGGNGGVPNSADFAIIEVADQDIGGQVKSIAQVTGRLGYKTNSLNTNHIKMLGYPVALDNGHIMHQVDSGTPAAGGSGTVLYGSDLTGGASGGPWIQNFGVQAAGQPSAGDDEMNRLVGITSYVFTASEPKVAGSSILNSEFTTLLSEACARDAGNCD
jgi:V8-like Glu-specific endopeptidase